MHEMSLCEGILQVIEDHAAQQRFAKVCRVRLEIGALAGVEIEALRFGFEVVTRNTIAEGAMLDIITLPGRAWCLGCSQSVAVQQRFDACPDCGSYQLQISGGDELRIKDLEVE
jgi:hydrogenase nickel incorporation protein HypA/HybF